MTHRYGRHGKNAWLRWREKRLRRTSLALAPQIAVLHIPVEFLSRIRKVTILMSDGTEETFQMPMNPLSSPIVESTTTGMRLNGSGQMENPQDKFTTAAKETAQNEAERAFKTAVDPYKKKPDVQGAREFAKYLYYGNDRSQQPWSLNEAQESYVSEFKAEFKRRLYELSAEHGAPTEETRQLLVFARKDKLADQEKLSAHPEIRTHLRAYISLFSDIHLCQEEVSEDILNGLRERMDLYQRFYKEFEPAKEED